MELLVGLILLVVVFYGLSALFVLFGMTAYYIQLPLLGVLTLAGVGWRGFRYWQAWRYESVGRERDAKELFILVVGIAAIAWLIAAYANWPEPFYAVWHWCFRTQ